MCFISSGDWRLPCWLLGLDGWKELLLSMMYAVAERDSIQMTYISLCPTGSTDEISAGT